MSSLEPIGIGLLDGPDAGYRQVYQLGWPPPEEIIVFRVSGQIAVSRAEFLERAYDLAEDAVVTRYRLVKRSVLSGDELPDVMVRGAAYEVIV